MGLASEVARIEEFLSSLGLDPLQGLTVVAAASLPDISLDPGMGLLVLDIHSPSVLLQVKARLLNFYPGDHRISFIGKGGVTETSLDSLDRWEGKGELVAIYLPPYPPGRDRTLWGLKKIVAALRGPGGCPWDREQTHESLKPCLLEETYEVLEAIGEGDKSKLQEELGDLLLQVVFHAQIAEEEGSFTLQDSLETICRKMRRRHPHVFGGEVLPGARAVLKKWEEIKVQENKGKRDLFAYPKGLPALARAFKVQEKAARKGFDWSEMEGVWAKVEEELRELKGACQRGQPSLIEAELGDLLFAAVNLARWLGVEPESALNRAVQRFIKRFHYMQDKIEKEGRDMEKLGLEDWDKLWEEAKNIEK